ncbi:MAG: glycosyltransferase family 4 protein [Rhizobacter sp.]
MSRTLLITTVAPYPKNVGKRVMLGGLCDWFAAERAPADFRVLSFDTLPPALDTGFPRLSGPSRWRKFWNLAWHTGLRRDKSMQEALFWAPQAQRQIAEAIADYEPELVIYDTLRAGQYHRHLPGASSFRAVLYLDDLFSVRYERILATLARFPGVTIDALGNFVEHIPKALLSLYHALPGMQRWLLRRERRLIMKSEDTQPVGFDLALLVSDHEVQRLRQRARFDHVFTLRPVLGGTGPARVPRRWSGRPVFVFLGSLNLPHNALSIELFIQMRFEALLDQIPDVRLVVAGRHAGPRLRMLAAKYPDHIELAGFVEDLDPLLAGCAGMIAPLLFGSGVKIKVIDALRMGVPVVATDYGAEGIATDGRRGLIVENDIDRFGAQCRRLLDPAVNAAESAASLALFEAHYSARVVRDDYDRLFTLPAPA